MDDLNENTLKSRDSNPVKPQSKTAQEAISKKNSLTIYQYCNEKNELLYERVRKHPKSFFLRRPDGKGDHIYSLKQGWYVKRKRGWVLGSVDTSG
jgi:hypothetical protein